MVHSYKRRHDGDEDINEIHKHKKSKQLSLSTELKIYLADDFSFVKHSQRSKDKFCFILIRAFVGGNALGGLGDDLEFPFVGGPLGIYYRLVKAVMLETTYSVPKVSGGSMARYGLHYVLNHRRNPSETSIARLPARLMVR
ncbi:hypothetical protein AKJ16_DCAP24112 [Drosera capensis]